MGYSQPDTLGDRSLLDKFLAVVSLAGLFLFIGVLMVKVDEFDLRLICGAVLIMAAIDFFLLNKNDES